MNPFYSREQLCSFIRDDLALPRNVRETLFTYGLWQPARRRALNKIVSAGGARSSAPALNTPTSVPVFSTLFNEKETPLDSRGSPVMTSHPDSGTGKQRISNVARTETEPEHPIPSTCKQMSFGMLNAQSVGNKFQSICSEITDKCLDVCFLTETWHSSSNDTALRR